MRRGPHTRQQRTALRRLARQLRRQDPALARLLSGSSRGLLPPLRLTSLPVTAYVTIGVVLLVTGLVLGVGSALLWGLVSLLLAGARHRAGRRPDPAPAPGVRGPGSHGHYGSAGEQRP